MRYRIKSRIFTKGTQMPENILRKLLWHFTCLLSEWSKINKTNDSLCWQRYRAKQNTQPLFVAVETVETTVEINMTVPHKDKNQSTARPSYITFAMSWNDYILLQWYLFIYIHHCFIHNMQKLETAFIFINKWLDN